MDEKHIHAFLLGDIGFFFEKFCGFCLVAGNKENRRCHMVGMIDTG